MKPTNRQIKVIMAIKSVIDSWLGSNDIDSPTVASDIREYLWITDDLLSDKDKEELHDNIRDLLSLVRKFH